VRGLAGWMDVAVRLPSDFWLARTSLFLLSLGLILDAGEGTGRQDDPCSSLYY
jgi:hypothetical protein